MEYKEPWYVERAPFYLAVELDSDLQQIMSGNGRGLASTRRELAILQSFRGKRMLAAEDLEVILYGNKDNQVVAYLIMYRNRDGQKHGKFFFCQGQQSSFRPLIELGRTIEELDRSFPTSL
jgi:hypothetical protein